MGSPLIQVDIAIIGGGIAGLWTLNQLRNRGFNAVLFEQDALGSYQTIGSQGMIHGGIKYALSGAWSGSSEAISAMPAIWRSCLKGEGKVDLRECKVLSEDFYLWSHTGLTSRVSSFFASKMLRGRVEKLARSDYPPPLSSPRFRGQAYRLIDLVLDVPSLVATLAREQAGAIFKIDWTRASLEARERQAMIKGEGWELQAKQVILTAGTGNDTGSQLILFFSPEVTFALPTTPYPTSTKGSTIEPPPSRWPETKSVPFQSNHQADASYSSVGSSISVNRIRRTSAA